MNTDNAVTIATIIVQTSGIVDLDMDLVLSNGNIQQTTAVATAVVGALYTMCLDVGSGSSQMVPEGLNTTH